MNLHEECLLKYLLNPMDLFRSTELLKMNNDLIEKGLIVDLMQKEPSQEEFDNVAVSEENISSKEVVVENEGYFNGERCVFKPYFEGYKDAGLVIIPVKKDAFENFNDKKQQRIFKSAFKKYQKKLKKKSK